MHNCFMHTNPTGSIASDNSVQMHLLLQLGVMAARRPRSAEKGATLGCALWPHASLVGKLCSTCVHCEGWQEDSLLQGRLPQPVAHELVQQMVSSATDTVLHLWSKPCCTAFAQRMQLPVCTSIDHSLKTGSKCASYQQQHAVLHDGPRCMCDCWFVHAGAGSHSYAAAASAAKSYRNACFQSAVE